MPDLADNLAGSGSGGHALLQQTFDEVAADVATSDAVPPGPDLLSRAIVITAGSSLHVLFTAACANTLAAGGVFFRLRIDGVVARGTAVYADTANATLSVALAYVATGLAAGAHTISIEWYVGAGTAQINAATLGYHHGSLVVSEYS